MKIDKRTRSTFLRGAFLALVLSMVLASSASASPAWKVNGLSLEGSETIAGDAIFGKFVIPGLTITCKKMHYTMTISNSAGTGKGELTSLTFQTCLTNTKACTIKSIEAEKLRRRQKRQDHDRLCRSRMRAGRSRGRHDRFGGWPVRQRLRNLHLQRG
jgi:hypothetical protein